MLVTQEQRDAARDRLNRMRADPAFEAKRIAAKRAGRRSFPLPYAPKWVPANLKKDYRIIAGREGKAYAARWARGVIDVLGFSAS